MDPELKTDIGALLKDTFENSTKSDNLVPLLVGALILAFGAALTLGILAAPLMLGFTRMCLKVARSESVEIGDIGSGFSDFVPALILLLLVAVAVVLTACTIVGPLIIALFFCFAFQLLADNPGAGAVDSLKASVELVKSNFGDSAIVFLIAMAINSVLGSTGIGAIPALAFATLLTSTLYDRLKSGADAPAASAL